MSSLFDQRGAAAVRMLVADYPFAWITADADPAAATPMPLLLECDDDGTPLSLLGHLPRAHPLVRAFAVDTRGSFLFNGPAAYVTPEWIADKDWAPTWNFAVVMIRGTVALDDALTDQALVRLVEHMERDRREPWTIAAMGDRFGRLAARVIGFRVTITASRARFKLGQDEGDADFAAIVAGLGDVALSRWMVAARRH